LGASSLNASAMEIRTSPKLGQSTRTQSRTYAGSVGMEDSLKLKSEKAEAAFSSDQAAEELRRTGNGSGQQRPQRLRGLP
jgi:hypothetical protein